MMRFSISFRAAEYYSLFISLLGHLAIAQLFIFTFNAQPVEFKPAFIFLGPLLRDADFKNLATTAVATPQASSQITIKNYPSAFESTRHVPKPAFLRNEPSKEKAYLKSSFVKPAEESPAVKAQDLGVEVTVPQRVPLKLNLK